LHYFNILSFGISLEMVGGSRILFMLPFWRKNKTIEH
jgi:hypothetical protein